jgi:hypothetical protein
MIKFNKKAEVGTTLTWFAAIFVIVFILIIFLLTVFLMADKKILTSSDNLKQNDLGVSDELGINENLFSILNSEISYNGKSIKAYDAILDSFDTYFETRANGVSLVEKYGVNKYEDISGTSRDKMVNSGFDNVELDKIYTQNQMLALELKKKLDLYCSKYKLAVPEGVLTEEGKFESSDNFENGIYEGWTPVAKLSISYRGVFTEIRFTELKECSGNGIIGGQSNDQ